MTVNRAHLPDDSTPPPSDTARDGGVDMAQQWHPFQTMRVIKVNQAA
jgi:hypothetical protein